MTEKNDKIESFRSFDFLKWLKPEYMTWKGKMLVAIGIAILIAIIYYVGVYNGMGYGAESMQNLIASKYNCIPKISGELALNFTGGG